MILTRENWYLIPETLFIFLSFPILFLEMNETFCSWIEAHVLQGEKLWRKKIEYIPGILDTRVCNTHARSRVSVIFSNDLAVLINMTLYRNYEEETKYLFYFQIKIHLLNSK